MKDQIERFKELVNESKDMAEKKIRLEEQYKNKKAALTDLVKEIKDAGYDPRNLGNVIGEKKESIIKEINSFEGSLQKVSSKLAEIEGA
jgi:hypothetical protein